MDVGIFAIINWILTIPVFLIKNPKVQWTIITIQIIVAILQIVYTQYKFKPKGDEKDV